MKRKHSEATKLKMSRAQKARHAKKKREGQSKAKLTYTPWIVKTITDTIRHFIG